MKSDFTPPHSHAARVRNNKVLTLSSSYIGRAAALCVVALVFILSFVSGYRAAVGSVPAAQQVMSRDSLPLFRLMAEQDDARACYIVAAAVHHREQYGDSLPGIADLTLRDANELVIHSAVLGYAPAQYTLALLIEQGGIRGTHDDIIYWLTESAVQGDPLAIHKLNEYK